MNFQSVLNQINTKTLLKQNLLLGFGVYEKNSNG